MPASSEQERILAKALFEIRVLLSGYLGSENDGDPDVRMAAHLAYALHNQALAVLSGDSFDAAQAYSRIVAADSVLKDIGSDLSSRFKESEPPE